MTLIKKMKPIKRGVIFTVLFVLLTGCTSGQSETPKEHIYTHQLGETKLSKENPRVVTDYYLGELKKLDVNVVGAKMAFVSPLIDKTGIEEIGDSVEKIVALKPDLIITVNQENYQKYKEIAPTVYLEYGKYNPEDQMREFGKIFNKTEKVEAWITTFNKRVNELKSQLKSADETYSIMKLWDKQIWVFGDNWGHGGYILYKKFGLKAPTKTTAELLNKKESYANISIENLPQYSGTTMLAMDFKDAPDITSSALFQSLPAVQNKKVKYLEANKFLHVDPYSLDNQLELLSGILNDGQ
ncbi:MAG: ABC transporter substrate-binding protein [Culicoidibacterales bacterium]